MLCCPALVYIPIDKFHLCICVAIEQYEQAIILSTFDTPQQPPELQGIYVNIFYHFPSMEKRK